MPFISLETQAGLAQGMLGGTDAGSPSSLGTSPPSHFLEPKPGTPQQALREPQPYSAFSCLVSYPYARRLLSQVFSMFFPTSGPFLWQFPVPEGSSFSWKDFPLPVHGVCLPSSEVPRPIWPLSCCITHHCNCLHVCSNH